MNANNTKERTRQYMTLGRRQYQRELALPEKKSNLNLIKVLVSNTISLDRGSCLTTPWEYNQYNPGCGKPYRGQITQFHQKINYKKFKKLWREPYI